MDPIRVKEWMPVLADAANIGIMFLLSLAFVGLVIFGIVKLVPMFKQLIELIKTDIEANKAVAVAITKVSDLVLTHDQRAVGGWGDVEQLGQKVDTLLQTAVTKQEFNEALVRIHERQDEVCGSVKKIMGKVGC
ncbi:hypothetical protein [Anaeroselena agilis]|uniref:Uncharacterized protein n=1 Tax=Anaeroselena agilis TaxID=3063788 RepID=A0ABU3P0X0_9FIRM|nr:hypothetical protein [Selenomonadales bacterium 4137-cl]